MPEISRAQLMRYSRQILLPALSLEGQERLLEAKVLIFGLGGLGCAALPYLAGSGIGQLTLVDDDRIEIHNLPRQILFRDSDLGQYKAEVAAREAERLSPDLSARAITHRLEGDALRRAVSEHQLVLDCTDQLDSRRAINRACFQAGVPLVTGAAIRLEGQISCFTMKGGQGPCYQCLSRLFGEQQLSCVESGVASPLVGIIGSLQAMEAVKLLTGMGQPIERQILLYDGLEGRFQSFNLNPDPACPVCSAERPTQA